MGWASLDSVFSVPSRSAQQIGLGTDPQNVNERSRIVSGNRMLHTYWDQRFRILWLLFFIQISVNTSGRIRSKLESTRP
jgi:hypothetical protein